MRRGKGNQSLKVRMVLLFCLSPLLASIAFSPVLGSASAQTSACDNVGCGQTHYAAEASGPYGSYLTYAWTNTNTCGSFGALSSFPGQAFWNYTFGTSGVGNALYCSSLQGMISVTVNDTYPGANFVVTCTDPNGATGADFAVAGPNGTTTCTYPNGTSTPPRGAPFTIGDFYGQQTFGQVASASSTTSSPTMAATQSSSTGVPVSPGPLLTTSELTLLVVSVIGILAVISIAYLFRGRLGLSSGGGPGKTQEKPPTRPPTTPPNPDEPQQTGGTPPGQGKPPGQPVKLGISITKCAKTFDPTGMGTTSFVAKIYQCIGGQGWVECNVPGVITFKLHYVSNLAGFCMNGGQPDAFAPDLWFSEEENGTTEWEYPQNLFGPDARGSAQCEDTILGQNNGKPHFHYQWIKTKGPKNEVTVNVHSEDYGAWGWIEATAPGCENLPPREDEDSPVPCPPEGDKCCVAVGVDPKQKAYLRDGDPTREVKNWKTAPDRIKSWWVKIPRDENNNNIPDYMEKWDRGNDGEDGAKRDEDDHPGGVGNGDGLTVFEEYRGFVIEDGTKIGHHVRTDPAQKTVFVFVPNNDPHFKELGGLVDSDNAMFGETKLEIYKITEPYYGGSPKTKFVTIQNQSSNVELNFNRDWGRGKSDINACSQSAIWLKSQDEMPPVLWGFACTAGDAPALTKAGRELTADTDKGPSNDGTPGTPGFKTHCCINVKACLTDAKKFPNRLNQIVAHELGHAINIQHHGAGGLHPHPAWGGNGCWQGLVSSGDESCVMHYDEAAKFWCEPNPSTVKPLMNNNNPVCYPGTTTPMMNMKIMADPTNTTSSRTTGKWAGLPDYMHPYDTDHPGFTYCSTNVGTGDNDIQTSTYNRVTGTITKTSKNNAATLGGCRGYLKVKDWDP